MFAFLLNISIPMLHVSMHTQGSGKPSLDPKLWHYGAHSPFASPSLQCWAWKVSFHIKFIVITSIYTFKQYISTQLRFFPYLYLVVSIFSTSDAAPSIDKNNCGYFWIKQAQKVPVSLNKAIYLSIYFLKTSEYQKLQ